MYTTEVHLETKSDMLLDDNTRDFHILGFETEWAAIVLWVSLPWIIILFHNPN